MQAQTITNEGDVQVRVVPPPTVTLTANEVAVVMAERQLEQAKRDNIITSYSLSAHAKGSSNREFYGYTVHWDEGKCRSTKTYGARIEAATEATAIVAGIVAERNALAMEAEYVDIEVEVPAAQEVAI